MPSFSPQCIKVCPGHRLRRKKSKIAAVPTHVPLKALYLVGGGLIVPPNENAVCTAAILDFCQVIITIKVLNHSERCYGR